MIGEDRYIPGGYIVLARQLLESRAWKICNNEQRGMLIYTLLEANYKENTWWDGSKSVIIPRGSFVTGRKAFAGKTHTTEQRVRTFWKKMESINFLTIKPTNKNSIITIVNYDEYQNKGNYAQPLKQPTEQPTSNQQATTTNKGNISNKISLSVLREIIEAYKQKKGYNQQPDWDKYHFTRHTKPAKELYEVAGQDWQAAMEWVSRQGYSDWTIETVIKKFPDYKQAKERSQNVPDYLRPVETRVV
jgi:hypothetical protein